MNDNNWYIDGRILKTRKALKKSFLNLLQNKDFEDISVTDIVEETHLNRRTFYNHYNNKEELINQMIEDALSELAQAFRQPYKINKPFIVDKMSPEAVPMFKNIQENAGFYRTMLISGSLFPLFQQRLSEKLKELYSKELNVFISNFNNEMIADYLAYATVGVIVGWVRGGFKYSADYMAEHILQLMKIAPHQTFRVQ